MTTFLYEPPRPDRKVKSMLGRSPNRKADSAVEHVIRGGMPVNPSILKAVREQLASGYFKDHPTELVSAVKSDPGLFAHVARHMKNVSEDGPSALDPLSQLHSLEQEKLAKIFNHSEREISTHRLRDATPAQLLRLQQSIISSRTAESIAAKVDLSGDLAFSSALLRQLGHNLVAWNYPDLYARALMRQRTKGDNLDLELQKLLGLTPAQIASRIASDWSMSPELRWAIAPQQQAASNVKRSEIGEHQDGKLSLREICDLSELFAKANDPAHYPEAGKKWHEAEHLMLDNLGLDIPRIVMPSVQQSLGALQTATTHAIHTPFFESQSAPSNLTEHQLALLGSNQFIRRCVSDTRKLFELVYQRILTSGISVDAIRVLVDEVVPKLGFVRGCLYLFKRDLGVLKPALRVGDAPLSTYRECREGESNPISESLHSAVLLKYHRSYLGGGDGLLLYCSLLSEKHPGVLHLEVDPRFVEDASHDSSLLFHAIRLSFVHCFGPS